MAQRNLLSLLKDTSAAVAPTVALSLFGLIAAGGLAFDYARMASLDTELQNAADQAALAAASQLDGKVNARARALSAAQTLVVNQTRFANDSNASGRTITVPTLVFYQSYDADADTPGALADTDANAKFVQVTTGTREAFFALTPIVAAARSGNLSAAAVAGIGGAVCKVPPLMICNPNEDASLSFPLSTDEGIGLKLEAGGGGAWAPGNYGYLNFGNGANALERALGANSDIADCVSSDSIGTKTGNNASVTTGLNTRLDIYDNGLTAYCSVSPDPTASTPGLSQCSPAMNTRKDIIRPKLDSSGPGGGGGNSKINCRVENGKEAWIVPTVQYEPGVTPTNMGFPRDECHAGSTAGSCLRGRFGNGEWNRATYFSVNHTAADLTAAVSWAGRANAAALTRYDVYKWEIATNKLSPREAEKNLEVEQENGNGKKKFDFYSYSSPRCAVGAPESTTQKDRRVLTAAVINCNADNVAGSTPAIKPIGWVDLLFVEPSLDRKYTGKDQIYVEVIGTATRPGGGNAFQYFLRSKPYLVK